MSSSLPSIGDSERERRLLKAARPTVRCLAFSRTARPPCSFSSFSICCDRLHAREAGILSHGIFGHRNTSFPLAVEPTNDPVRHILLDCSKTHSHLATAPQSMVRARAATSKFLGSCTHTPDAQHSCRRLCHLVFQPRQFAQANSPASTMPSVGSAEQSPKTLLDLPTDIRLETDDWVFFSTTLEAGENRAGARDDDHPDSTAYGPTGPLFQPSDNVRAAQPRLPAPEQ